MAWVVSASIDADQTDTGTVTAVYTDTDGTTLTVTERATFTAAHGTAFAAACLAQLNAWQARKASERNAMNALVTDFGNLNPAQTATIGTPSSYSVELASPG